MHKTSSSSTLYSLFFEEITASSLVKVNHHGQPLMETAFPVNPGGFVIYSAVHEGQPEVNCVMHTHSLHGVAVSARADGRLPISQQSSITSRAFSICGFLGGLSCGEIPRAKGMYFGEEVQNAAMKTRAASALGQRGRMLLGWPK